MIKKTKAVVFTGVGKVDIDEIILPDIGPENVLVEIEYSSISIGTERWILLGKHYEPGKPNMTPFPHIPGYQAAGIVKEIGSNVEGVVPGDRVFSVGTWIADGWKGSCWGGHSQNHILHKDYVYKLPETVSTYEASGLLLAQVGYNGASRPRINPKDVVVVIGDGLVGQYAGQILRYRGAYVILFGHHPKRMEMALQYSANEVVNSKGLDISAFIRKRFLKGVQVVVDTTGKNEMVRKGLEVLQYEGQFVLLGYYPEEECLVDIHWLRRDETTVYCPNGFTRLRMEKTLELVANDNLSIKELITHTFPYTEASNVYQMIMDKSSEFLGIVFDWRNK